MTLLILKTITALVDVILLMFYPPGNFRQLNFEGEATSKGISRNSTYSIRDSNNITTGLNYTQINKIANEAVFGVRDWWAGEEATSSVNRKSWSDSPSNTMNLEEWLTPQSKRTIDNAYGQFCKLVSSTGCKFGGLLHNLPGGTFITYHLLSALPSCFNWDEFVYPFQQAAIFGSDCTQYEYIPFPENNTIVLDPSLTTSPVTTIKPLTLTDEDGNDNRLYKRHSVKIRK